jgi:microsomal dipeptidase-like Zn-dependent dipeptidase/anthranilate/para-aminobenzoate synthase component II
MNKFEVEAQLDSIYAQFPGAEHRPVIGITGNYEGVAATLGQGYYKSVIQAGGIPFIIPPCADKSVLLNTLDKVDALILSGGADINPLYCGEEPIPQLRGINSERDLPELLITRLAYNRQLPILGICRGIQTLACALGGKVAQDIGSEKRAVKSEKSVSAIKHSQDADRSEPTHSVSLCEDSTLFKIYKQASDSNGQLFTLHSSLFTLYVNSFHHQAVSDTGSKFRVVATAPDGVIEAIESTEYKSILGVQWHPECMAEGLPLFQWLVGEARAYRQAQELHNRVLTLDTHCDTPMFFPQGIHFDQRDKRILVDLHKMTEGRLDATIMVAYLPQPKEGESFPSKVHFDVKGPAEYADLIFDKIEEIVHQNYQYLSLAHTPDDLYDNKRHGLKSIMLGIENGLALGGDLQQLQHFAERGVVYMTLCHNGDNDICDSARGSNTHNGVSSFGKQVIHEMNRLGMMVDLSHASEKSFYDALDISRQPIVCSHSSCRSLCDHPRNLTDEQMRALAAKGGVMQITLYDGFLRKDGGASVLDAMAHLEHAIKVMGIDHVGIGTDFDGDGGVPGLADASELINFTRQLLKRQYNERDIQKIWGGNFLRVMEQVQKELKD